MATKLQVPSAFDEAPNDERIAFVASLWDRIARDPSQVEIPVAHQRILDERLRAYQDNPEAGVPWHEVRDQLLGRLRQS